MTRFERDAQSDMLLDRDEIESQKLNELWSTFRLPVPIPEKIESTIDDAEGDWNSVASTIPSFCPDNWFLELLQLLQLLIVMEQQILSFNNSESMNYSYNKERTIKSQMSLATSKLSMLQNKFLPLLHEQEQFIQNSDEVDEALFNFHANIGNLLKTLKRETENRCSEFQRWLDYQHSRQINGLTSRTQLDLIDEIFLLPDDHLKNTIPSALEENEYQNFSDELADDFESSNEVGRESHHDIATLGDHDAQHSLWRPTMPTTQQNKPASKNINESVDRAELQQQQQNLLEEELSALAMQLKSSTLAMNTTLRTQTKELEDIETLAQSNLDSVTSTTKKVENRLANKRGWKKKLATWSLIGTVIGIWALCIIVIRTLPKRKIGEMNFFRQIMRRIKGNVYKLKYDKAKTTIKNGDFVSWGYDENEMDSEQRQNEEQFKEHWSKIKKDKSRSETQQGDPIFSSDRKAQELVAERKRQRLEEKMAKASVVIPVEIDIDEWNSESNNRIDIDDENDWLECISLTPNMRELNDAIKSLENQIIAVRESIEQAADKPSVLPDSSIELVIMLESELKSTRSRLEYAKKAAIDKYSEDIQSELNDVSFCDDKEYDDLNDFSAEDQVTAKKTTDVESLSGNRGKISEVEMRQSNVEETDRERVILINDTIDPAPIKASKPTQEEALHLQKVDLKTDVNLIELENETRFDGVAKPHRLPYENRERLDKEAEARHLSLKAETQPGKDAEAYQLQIGEQERLDKEIEAHHLQTEGKKQIAEEIEVHQLEIEDKEGFAKETKCHLQSEEETRFDNSAETYRVQMEEETRFAEVVEVYGPQTERETQFSKEADTQSLTMEEKRFAKMAEAQGIQIETETHIAKDFEPIIIQIEQVVIMANVTDALAKNKNLVTEEENKSLRTDMLRTPGEQLEAEVEVSVVEQDHSRASADVKDSQKNGRKKSSPMLSEKLDQYELKPVELLEFDKQLIEEQIRRNVEMIRNEAKTKAKEALERAKGIDSSDAEILVSDVLSAARRSDNDQLAHYLSKNPDMAVMSDKAGWQPLHEAARGGNLVGVELLISMRCDLNARTGRSANGGTALWWALQRYGEDHVVVKLLRSYSASDSGPNVK